MHARSTVSLLTLSAIAVVTAMASADPPHSAQAPVASASAAPPAASASAAAPPLTEDGEIPYGDIPPGSLVWHHWRFFDPYLSRREAVISATLLHDREIGTDIEHSGFAIGGGPSIESHYGYVFFRGQVQYGFRFIGGKQFVPELGQFAYGTGLRLGPVELVARAGLTVADVYFGKGGFGLGFFSPRVAASASVDIGNLRLGFSATSELAWRWTGGPSQIIRGLAFDLAFVSPPAGPPNWYRIE